MLKNLNYSQNRFRFNKLFFTGLLTLCFSGCVSIADRVINDDDMNKMGVDAFEQIKQKTPIENSQTINRYVKCVANALIQELPRDSDGRYATGVSSWEVVVFQDNTANAFALPGGKIGVHTGLLKVATNQGQLAAVMGHEVAHVLAKHGKQRVVQSQGIGFIGAYIGPLLGNVIEVDPKTVQSAIGMGAQYGVMLPFGRAHESEADIIGQDLMAKAGFNPAASIQLWKNMAKASQGAPPEFMSTHPSAKTRIADLETGLNTTNPIFLKAVSAGKKPVCQ